MTNRLALVLALLVVAGLVIDLYLGLGGALFLARRFVDLLHWVAFWR